MDGGWMLIQKDATTPWNSYFVHYLQRIYQPLAGKSVKNKIIKLQFVL